MLGLASLVLYLLSASLARAGVLDDRFGHGPARKMQQSTNGGTKREGTNCRPLRTSFTPGAISDSPGLSPFIAVSPSDSYMTSIDGLRMFLKKPSGTVVRQGHVNNVVADGATINSTFRLLYGKVTFEMQAPAVAGSVTAGILISDRHDEIDVELLGGDVEHWQTNVYAPSPKDTQPLWGVFGEIHNVNLPPSVVEFHNYTIDWNEQRIIWLVNNRAVRTLKAGETNINGTLHYPTEPCRIQLGIWDASNPEGTSEWAKGPIDWQKSPSLISATVKSVSVECS